MIVLIIEDSQPVMDLWYRFLKPVACEIRQAMTLGEAFKLLKKIPPPDLILLDLRLPDSADAKETLSKIPKLREQAPKAVVVVITGAGEDSLPILAREVGADGFFDKGSVIGQTKLLESIKEACSLKTTEERMNLVERLSNFMLSVSSLPQT